MMPLRPAAWPLGMIVALALAIALPPGARAQGTGPSLPPPVAGPRQDDDLTCLLRPRHTVQLGSPVNGILSDVLVDRGDHVHTGQELARIESSVEEATVALDAARAADTSDIEAAHTEADMLSKKLDRTRALAGQQFATTASLEEITAQVEAARIKIRAAETRRRIVAMEQQRSAATLALRHIRSPVDGVVIERRLEAGDYVSEQTPILVIATVDPLIADVIVPGERYGALKVGGTAEVRPLASLGGSAQGSVQGRIDAIDPVIDAASNTFGVRVLLPNPGERIPAGLRCEVRWSP